MSSKISRMVYYDSISSSIYGRPGNDEIQLIHCAGINGTNDFLCTKTCNLTSEAINRHHNWLSRVRTMKIFVSAGADAFKKDLKDVEINLLNGGHFVLEEKTCG
jgi:hypothetical protein